MYPYNNKWLNNQYSQTKPSNSSDEIQLFFQLHNVPQNAQSSQISLSHDTSHYTGNQPKIGSTEKNSNSKNPLFSTAITVEFTFQKKQTLIASLLLNNGAFKDQVSFTLGELVGNKNNCLNLKFPQCGVSIKIMFEGSINQHHSATDERTLFSNYLQGSLNISVVACIDFTASNKMPQNPDSLHYMNMDGLNDYQAVIHSVCDILLDYDADKLIQVYGFGGAPQYPGFGGQVSHFFPVSGDWNNCAGVGVEGVFDIYGKGLKNIQLSGPTFFSPMLKEINQFTEANFKQDPNNYTVLLVITDGCIHDMNQTIEQVVNGSTLPLSVIIVGVGNADFTNMEILDSDDVVLTDSRGRKAARDIVQFVPFEDFRQEGVQVLAEEVLEEVPRQVVQFMQAIGKKPKNSRRRRRQQKSNRPEYGKPQPLAGNMRTKTPDMTRSNVDLFKEQVRKKKYRNSQINQSTPGRMSGGRSTSPYRQHGGNSGVRRSQASHRDRNQASHRDQNRERQNFGRANTMGGQGFGNFNYPSSQFGNSEGGGGNQQGGWGQQSQSQGWWNGSQGYNKGYGNNNRGGGSGGGYW